MAGNFPARTAQIGVLAFRPVLHCTKMSDRSTITLRPFSLRHAKSLADGKLPIPVVSEPLRNRIWSTLRNHNEPIYYTTPDNPNWTHNSDVLEQSEISLGRLLGIDQYKDGFRQPADLQNLVLQGPPDRLFDLLEIVYAETPPENRISLQRAINDALVDFVCPWRLSDGMLFRVDSEFLEQDILSRTAQLLGGDQFKGASDEFNIARDKLTDGAVRDAISYASHSFESTLKAATGLTVGDAGTLIAKFIKDGNMDDLPPEKAKAVAKALQGISILRNELGGHGQGAAVLDPSRAYAELAVHLAGSVNQFVIEQYLRKNPPPAPVVVPPATQASFLNDEMDDEIPF